MRDDTTSENVKRSEPNLELLKDMVDNPEDPMTAALIADVDFYCNNLELPKEIVQNLVCRAYMLGQIRTLSVSSNKIRNILNPHIATN